MTYISDKIEHQGIPYLEFRTEPQPNQLIEISFTPTYWDDIYEYDNPKFTLAQSVVIAQQWDYCCEHGIDFHEEHEVYRICALELVEPTSRHSNGLTEAPYWMFGIRGTRGTKELIWFSEDELLSLAEIKTSGEF